MRERETESERAFDLLIVDCRTVGGDFGRGVQNYAGTMLSVTPKPWANGDTLVASQTTGDAWTYTLIFELIAPLRDLMMYENEKLTQNPDLWAIWTRALTDCNSKTVDADRKGGMPFSTSQVYDHMKDPNYKDIHHYILQYLEEGAIELVCLSTDLDMEHCDTMRETAGSIKGERYDDFRPAVSAGAAVYTFTHVMFVFLCNEQCARQTHCTTLLTYLLSRAPTWSRVHGHQYTR